MKIGIGNDHAAVDMKNEVVEYLKEKGYEVVNYGTDTTESCHYPAYGEKVGKAVASGEVDLGILICGTGVGISLAANKVKGIRAVVCSEPYSAKLSRQHNNTNILAFGARVVWFARRAQRIFSVTEKSAGTELEHFVNVGNLVDVFARKERPLPDGDGAQDAALMQDLQIPLGLLQFPAERLGGQ